MEKIFLNNRSLKKKPLLVVLGCGESGLGAALLGSHKGYKVFVSDFGKIDQENINILQKNNILWEENAHTSEIILKANKVVKSPGISNESVIVKKIRDKDIPIVSEIEFAYYYSCAKFIGITGSNGKTTTSFLTHYILKQAGLQVDVAGNIGDSLAEKVIGERVDTYVLELSSFQLENIVNFAPHIAMITNITPDHLDRYQNNFQKYIAAKFLIAKNQNFEDYFIYDADDPIIAENLKKYCIKSQKMGFSICNTLEKGAFVKNNQMVIKYDKTEFIMDISEIKINGKHNLKNAMAASLSAKLLNIQNETIRNSLMGFEGVEHRLEDIGVFEQVHYINDSKATNINATYYALDSIKGSIVWIVGGVDKGNDYFELMPLVREKVRAIICLGRNNQKILQTYRGVIKNILETQNMDEAISLAKRLSRARDTVLLSPACASFDIFENYQKRGERFKQAVKNLYQSKNFKDV